MKVLNIGLSQYEMVLILAQTSIDLSYRGYKNKSREQRLYYIAGVNDDGVLLQLAKEEGILQIMMKFYT